MHVDSYTFGRMVVDGKVYTDDLLVLPGGVRPNWWREHGHSVYEGDLEDVIDAGPDVLVIGTGAHGHVNVPEETWEALAAAGIETRIEKTGQAVQTYNRLAEEGRNVAGAFHLTC